MLPLDAGSVRSVSRRDVIRSTIYSGSTGRSVVAIKPESKGRHHSIARQPAMGPLSGFVAGSSSWSSRPPAFARQVARSHRGWVRFTLGSRSFPGSRRPATWLRFSLESTSSPIWSSNGPGGLGLCRCGGLRIGHPHPPHASRLGGLGLRGCDLVRSRRLEHRVEHAQQLPGHCHDGPLVPLRFLSREKTAAHFGLVLTSRQADSTRAHRNSPEPSLVI